MTKSIIAITLFMSMIGCASVSQYDQGCRDGIGGLSINPELKISKENTEKYCDALDAGHNQKNQDQEPHGPTRQ